MLLRYEQLTQKMIRDYFKPGSIIWCEKWNQFSIVLSYTERVAMTNYSKVLWNVTSMPCDSMGNVAEFETTRTHATSPTKADFVGTHNRMHNIKSGWASVCYDYEQGKD